MLSNRKEVPNNVEYPAEYLPKLDAQERAHLDIFAQQRPRILLRRLKSKGFGEHSIFGDFSHLFGSLARISNTSNTPSQPPTNVLIQRSMEDRSRSKKSSQYSKMDEITSPTGSARSKSPVVGSKYQQLLKNSRKPGSIKERTRLVVLFDRKLTDMVVF